MFVRRSTVVKLVALCLLAAPGVALGQQRAAEQPTGETRAAYRSNKTLTRVIIFGSIGAIAGALGSLRKRNGSDAMGNDDENSKA